MANQRPRSERVRALIKMAKEAAATARADDDSECEFLFTPVPEDRYGTPYPEGTEMTYEALRELAISQPASMLIQ